MNQHCRTIGPYSRKNVWAKLDGRGRPEQYRRRIVNDLTAQLGGSPTAAQRILTDHSALLALKLALMEERITADTMSEHDGRYFLAWTNALTRTLRRLGIKILKKGSQVDTLREALRRKPGHCRCTSALAGSGAAGRAEAPRLSRRAAKAS